MMFITEGKKNWPDSQNRPEERNLTGPTMLPVGLKSVGSLACAQRCKMIFRLKIKALLGGAARFCSLSRYHTT
jgi:hypothetical protein